MSDETRAPKIEPTQWPATFDVHGSVHLAWMYPRIYDGADLRDRITISLYQVRAANSISIEYDADRDGWLIRMDKTRDMGGYSETIEEDVEVAFIPAWNEAEAAPSEHGRDGE